VGEDVEVTGEAVGRSVGGAEAAVAEGPKCTGDNAALPQPVTIRAVASAQAANLPRPRPVAHDRPILGPCLSQLIPLPFMELRRRLGEASAY
jgi:hypothetical protein